MVMDILKKFYHDKAFMSFFKRSLLLLLILFAEVLVLTTKIGFAGIKLGFVKRIASDNLHQFVLMFVVIFAIISITKFIGIKNLEKINYKRFIPFFILNLIAYYGFFKLNYFFFINSSDVVANPLLYDSLWIILALTIGLSWVFACFSFIFL